MASDDTPAGTVTVAIATHEREAMYQLMLLARSLAGVVSKHDQPYAVRTKVHAQIVEDFLTRIEQ